MPSTSRPALRLLAVLALVGAAAAAPALAAPSDPDFYIDCPDEPVHVFFDMSAGTSDTIGPGALTCDRAAPSDTTARHGSISGLTTTWPGNSVAHSQITPTGANFSVKSENPIPAGSATLEGTQGLMYEDDDGNPQSTSDTYTLVLHAVTEAPTCAKDGTASTKQGQAVAVEGSCTGDGVTTTVDEAPKHGTLGAVSETGAVTYTPAAGWSGTDAFTLRSANVVGATTRTVTVTVAPPVKAPVEDGVEPVDERPAPLGPVAGPPVVAPPAAEPAARVVVPGPWELLRTGEVRVTARRGGGISVATGFAALCPAGTPACTGRVTLKVWSRSARTGRRFRLFTTGKVQRRSIPGGTQQALTFDLGRRARRELRRRGSLQAVLRGSVRHDGGAPVVREAAIRLVAPARR